MTTDISCLTPAQRAIFETFQSKRVVHARQKEIFEEVWNSLEVARSKRNVTVLVGPTGVGKSNLVEAVQLATIAEFKRSKSVTGQVPYLTVRAAPPLHDIFRWPSLYRSILEVSDQVLRTHPGGRPKGRPTSDGLQWEAINVLRHRQPLAFCIDEAQHMTYALGPKRLQMHLDMVKWLADESGVPILLAGTQELLDFSLSSGQFARRMTFVPFMPYRTTPEDLSGFLGAVRHFLRELPLDCSLDPRTDRDFFYEGSAGSIGVLKEWFERVLVGCLRAGRKTATRKDFEETQLDYGGLTVVSNDRKKIERGLLAIKGDRDTLRESLGMPRLKGKKPYAPATREPGLRDITRDPVGIEEDAA